MKAFLCTCALSLAAAALSVPSADRAAVQAMNGIIRNRGGVSNVVGGPTHHGLGLLAAEELKAGDVAVRVPQSCLLSEAQMTAELRSLYDAVPAEFWAARLGLILLSERSKGAASSWSSYIQTLPASYTVPLFWTPEAIQRLQYPALRARLLKRARFVSSFAAEHLASASASAAFSGRSASADALGWAIAACSSRAALVGSQRVLCPIIDVGNHRAKGDANCEIRATQGGALELVATRPISLGQECCYCYGELTDDDFLLDYGFMPPHNSHDSADLTWADGALLRSACVAAGVKTPSTDWQRVALRSALPVGLEAVSIRRDGLEPRALAACRIAAAPDAASLRKSSNGRKPLSQAAAEMTALKIGAAIAAIGLAGLPDQHEGAAVEASSGSDGAAVEASSGSDGAAVEASSGSDGVADASQVDVGVGLAECFMSRKRELCAASLAVLGERIKALQNGEARAGLRGNAKGKQVTGLRKQSARVGAVSDRPKASGFRATRISDV